MAYFVVYLAFMELYSEGTEEGLYGDIKYIMPYAGYTLLMWFILLIGFYIIGLPLGIGAYPGL
jgi:aminobenzoyl-glutamate transport protein